MHVNVRDIVEATRDLGLSGHPICVHSSLGSFGWVRGGASAIVDGLLAEECTVMVPSFSWTFAIPPPPDSRPVRNGWDYDGSWAPTTGVGRVYTPDTMEVDRDMGAISAEVVTRPGRIRGNHPLCSFSAVGPLASELLATQLPLNVFAPLELLAQKNGLVALMGVDLTRMTLIHLAEQTAGNNLFRRWANGPDGCPMAVEVGGCSDGFGGFQSVLAPLMKHTIVGHSAWTVVPARGALEATAKAIREDPQLTHCGDTGCMRCNDAVMGGPLFSPEG